MPYTLVHPAFVFPLKKWRDKWFSYDALIIGSFVPDFDIIFRFTENRFHIYTFTFLNILTVIFPIGVITYILYIHILKKTIIYLFQMEIKSEINYKDFRNTLKIIFSIFFAIIVHILLDNLTHPDANILIYKIKMLSPIPIVPNYMYLFCLYGPLVISSALGGILLISFLLENNIITSKSVNHIFEGKRIYFWCIMLITFILFFFIKIKINGLEEGYGIDSILLFSLSALFYGFVISCVLFRFLF